MDYNWQYGKPPNEVLVEVEDHDGTIRRVYAFYGRDGYLPHWVHESGLIHWEVKAFRRWRYFKMTILCKKYGQVTRVFLDDKLVYESGCTVKAEAKHLRALLEAMTIINVEVVEG